MPTQLLCWPWEVTTYWTSHSATGIYCCYHVHNAIMDAGDQTGNLWWRLLNGQIFLKHPPQVSVMLIGTNDLATASCGVGEPGIIAAVPGVFQRYQHVLSFLA